jgi:integrase
MLYRVVRPVKRSGSSIPQFIQRIPADVRAQAIGRKLTIPLGNDDPVVVTITRTMQSIRFSLRTREPSVAKVRQAQAAAHLETVWQALRNNKPASLAHRAATALAGELYRAWSDEGRIRTTAITLERPGGLWTRDSVTPDEHAAIYEAIQPHLRPDDEEAVLEHRLGALVDRLLLAKGIAAVDPETRPVLLNAFALALRDAMELREREARGDYTPDPKAQRFPAWEPPGGERKAGPHSTTRDSLTALVEAWWREANAAGRKPSTYESYRNTMAKLVAFLGHDDAGRVVPTDIIRFKDDRLASGVSAKTVKDSDLAGLKTIFGWAVGNHRMARNPAAGLTIKVGKRQRLRSKGFTDEEAVAILRLASSYTGTPAEKPRTIAAKRWVPWLQAYTGARVGELAQLRKEDVRRVGAQWVLRITPEAGTVKSDEARDVVLHPHLVEMGFPEFVARSPEGHLFLKPAGEGGVRGPLRGLKNRLAEFARGVVVDRNVAPNHGWRHRFKTVGMEVGIAPRVLDAIQGQAPRTVGDTYGDVTVRTIAEAIGRLPRILDGAS